MKLDFKPLKPYVLPSFRTGDNALDPDLDRRLQRPIRIGFALIGVFVVGILGWAALAQVSSAIMAPGIVRVESNRKLIRQREASTVREILVKEGQHVTQGQVLLITDSVLPKASVDVLQNQADAFLAQVVRFRAEVDGRRTVDFPADLTARIGDPRVATVLHDQQSLFTTRLQYYDGQVDILRQRAQQVDAQISGARAQISANEQNIDLTQQELAGYQTLFEKGYAPKTLILRYQRSLADLAGRKGQLLSELTRLQEQKGEGTLQLANLRDQRTSQAAEGVRQMESSLADVMPRLTAARQSLDDTIHKSPVDGYVLELTQFTVGGVVGSGEMLMTVVPANAPLIVTTRLKPTDIDDIKVGMAAKVRLSAFNTRKVSPVEATVINVSADQLTDQTSGQGYFRADLKIAPSELTKLPKGAVIKPGMPAEVMITTGKKSVLSYIMGPLTDTIRDAMRDG